ncbi:MAG: hypothetical protein CHACPFDD_00270 [Phycisphaerae bacterium]|nr:hypothetical protein [Phycisphaerae bacterium]
MGEVQQSNGSFTITNGVAFGIEAEARSGAAHGYAATVPAGQVGLWCSHASANSFDNFKVRDLVGPYEADGRWFSDKAEVQIDDSNNNLLRSSSATSTEYYDTCIVRRGFRAGKYVATFRFKWAPGPSPGFLVRWVNPGDWLAVMVKAADSKAWVYKRVNDGILQSPLSPRALQCRSSSGFGGPALVRLCKARSRRAVRRPLSFGCAKRALVRLDTGAWLEPGTTRPLTRLRPHPTARQSAIPADRQSQAALPAASSPPEPPPA